MMEIETIWLVIGLSGQALFAGRFLVQWLTSERLRRSVVPLSFWYLSIAGACVLLMYALYRRDPVFIIGQSTGLFIYSRNLMLIRQRARHGGTGADAAEPADIGEL